MDFNKRYGTSLSILKAPNEQTRSQGLPRGVHISACYSLQHSPTPKYRTAAWGGCGGMAAKVSRGDRFLLPLSCGS